MQCTVRRVWVWRYAVLLLAQFNLLQSEMEIPSIYHQATPSPTAHLERNSPQTVSTRTEPPQPNFERPQSFRHFLTNDSYIGQSIPCTHSEKQCFRFNLLSGSSGCQDASGYNGCDIIQLLNRNGHLRNIPSTLIKVEQPEEEGRCRIPDLRFPYRRSQVLQNPFQDIQGFQVNNTSFRPLKPIPRFTCSSEQEQCFSEGEVWVAEGQGCFPLLEKGPCAEEHVVALDVLAAREGRAEATCVHVRGGCPDGHVRMAFDEQCHRRDIYVIVNGGILKNQFGKFIFTPKDTFFYFQPFREVSMGMEVRDFCAINAFLISTLPPSTFRPASRPLCGGNNDGDCRHEVKPDVDRVKPDV